MSETSAGNKMTDPLTYVLWGIALIAGGCYMMYISGPFTYEWNLVLLSVLQSLALMVFGLLLVLRGVRGERQRKKK